MRENAAVALAPAAMLGGPSRPSPAGRGLTLAVAQLALTFLLLEGIELALLPSRFPVY